MRSLIRMMVVAALLAAPLSAQAEGRRFFNGPNRNNQRAAYAAAVYPKYQAGFHSRQLQNIGLPSGDIGIRGNNIFMNPW